MGPSDEPPTESTPRRRIRRGGESDIPAAAARTRISAARRVGSAIEGAAGGTAEP